MIKKDIIGKMKINKLNSIYNKLNKTNNKLFIWFYKIQIRKITKQIKQNDLKMFSDFPQIN